MKHTYEDLVKRIELMHQSVLKIQADIAALKKAPTHPTLRPVDNSVFSEMKF